MDDLDQQKEFEDLFDEMCIKNIQDKAAKIPKGTPGDCDLCGEWSGRLVSGACAPCRDKYKLP